MNEHTVWWQPGEYVALGHCLTVIAADSSRVRAKEKAIAAGCSTPLVVPASALANPEECASVPPPDRVRQPVNQCDGCRAGKPVDEYGNHRMGDGFLDLMRCTKDRYK